MSPLVLMLTIISVCLSAGAQVALKHGMTHPATQEALASGTVGAVRAVASQPFVLLGLAMYGVGAMVWLLVLARVEVSRAYPFVGLGFLLVMALGASMLGESIGTARWVGTVLVAAGVLCVAMSA